MNSLKSFLINNVVIQNVLNCFSITKHIFIVNCLLSKI